MQIGTFINILSTVDIAYEPRHEKTFLRGLRIGKTHPGLLSYRSYK